jgi:hypothetical protein
MRERTNRTLEQEERATKIQARKIKRVTFSTTVWQHTVEKTAFKQKQLELD